MAGPGADGTGERRSVRPKKTHQEPSDEELEQQAQRERDVAAGRSVEISGGTWCRRCRPAE